METLNRLTIEPERVLPIEIEISDYDRIPGIVGEFVEQRPQARSQPLQVLEGLLHDPRSRTG